MKIGSQIRWFNSVDSFKHFTFVPCIYIYAAHTHIDRPAEELIRLFSCLKQIHDNLWETKVRKVKVSGLTRIRLNSPFNFTHMDELYYLLKKKFCLWLKIWATLIWATYAYNFQEIGITECWVHLQRLIFLNSGAGVTLGGFSFKKGWIPSGSWPYAPKPISVCPGCFSNSANASFPLKSLEWMTIFTGHLIHAPAFRQGCS